MSKATGAPNRAPRGKYQRHGRLIKLAAEISGRSPRTVHAVLTGAVSSAPVDLAICQAYCQIKAAKETAA